MNDKEFIENVFTKENDNINLRVNNASVTCLTSNNNNFNLDSDGNLTVKSINFLEQQALAMQDVFDKVYPVGSIYMTFNDVSPATLFGGTWDRVAKGRTLVGIDEDDVDFDESKKVGGIKNVQLTLNQIPSHYHDGLFWGGITGDAISGNGGTVNHLVELKWFKAANDNPFTTGRAGGSKPHSNLQPYITCYIWSRIL